MTKRSEVQPPVSFLAPVIPEHVRLVWAREARQDGHFADVYRCEHTIAPTASREASAAVFRLLREADGVRRVGDLLSELDDPRTPLDAAAVTAELIALWKRRLIWLLPPSRVPRTSGEPSSATTAP